MATMTVTEARAKMREALKRVKDGEEIEITQNGEVVAVWLHPSKLRYRVRTPAVIEAEKMAETFRKLQDDPPPLGQGKGLSAEFAEDLVREIREQRDYDAWDRARDRHEDWERSLKEKERRDTSV